MFGYPAAVLNAVPVDVWDEVTTTTLTTTERPVLNGLSSQNEKAQRSLAVPLVLYVEDDPSLNEWVDFELTQEGYEIITAANGTHGLSIATGERTPDLILLDVSLPGMTGFEICRALRQHPATAEVPVIFLTARTELADRLDGFDAGGVDYLSKPFAMVELKARIRALLHQSRWAERRSVAALHQEMTQAAELQQALINREPPAVAGLTIFSTCRPARHTGGDFFDFVPDDRGVWLMEGDVSGKGLPAALMMTATRTALRTNLRANLHIDRDTEPDAWPDPATALSQTNADLYADLTEVEKFVTLFIAAYDAASRRLIYANAGHSLVVYCPAGDTPQILEADGPPLGVLDAVEYGQHQLTLAPGDLLLVCSDGIFEAENERGERFGYDRLLETVASLAPESAETIGQALFTAVGHFTGRSSHQADDQTVVVLKGIGHAEIERSVGDER